MHRYVIINACMCQVYLFEVDDLNKDPKCEVLIFSEEKWNDTYFFYIDIWSKPAEEVLLASYASNKGGKKQWTTIASEMNATYPSGMHYDAEKCRLKVGRPLAWKKQTHTNI